MKQNSERSWDFSLAASGETGGRGGEGGAGRRVLLAETPSLELEPSRGGTREVCRGSVFYYVPLCLDVPHECFKRF